MKPTQRRVKLRDKENPDNIITWFQLSLKLDIPLDFTIT